MTIRLGYQIPNFTYPDGDPAAIFPTVVAQAREAEASGFDTVLLMDHFYQLPMIGTPDQPMLECYTTLGALASATSTVRLSALVTGNTYRNPALLAKTVTTLDVVSGGRAVLGIGAGWFEREHHDYGFEFGTFTQRFERLEEALHIIQPMLRGQAPTVSGTWYRAENALNNPRLRPDIPIMIGGGGEQKTFRLAAHFADHLNIICGRAEIPRKVAALQQRCEEAGRDPATLPTSYLVPVLLTDSPQETRSLLEQMPESARGWFMTGTADEVVEHLHEEVLEPGIDGLVISLVQNSHVPGRIAQAGEALSRLLNPVHG